MRSEDRLSGIIAESLRSKYDPDDPEFIREEILDEIWLCGFFLREREVKSPVFRSHPGDVAMSPKDLIGFWRDVAEQYSPEICRTLLTCASELEGALLGRPWGGK